MASLDRCPATSKVMYRSQEQAIRRALISSRKRGVALRIYLCPACGHRHLTKRRSFAIAS
jgi:uncharacterized protein YlaI